MGGGKALALDTPILTTDGWSTMGQLAIGDFVFDTNGYPVEILGATEVMHDHKCYEVLFDDGERIVADAGHLWYTQTVSEREKNSRRSPEFREARKNARIVKGTGKRPDLAQMNRDRKYKYLPANAGGVRTTEQIANSLLTGRHNTVNHTIPIAQPLLMPKADLLIDPYVLGAWLGDGTSVCGGFCSADAEIINEIEHFGYRVTKQKSNKYGYTIRGLKVELRKIGVLGNKHIPLDYLMSSPRQRLCLLQGLMDTDGCIDRSDGGASFSNTNKRLIDAVLFLALSLGIKATVRESRAKLNGKDCGPKWDVVMRTDKYLFRLARKADRIKPVSPNSRCTRRYIKEVNGVASVPVRCIQVIGGMFLAGSHLVPTHNSYFLCMDALRRCLAWNNNVVGIYRWELSSFKATTLATMQETILGKYNQFVAQHNQQDHWILFKNGSKLRYGGLKPSESAAGDILKVAKSLEMNAIYLDEVTDIPQQVFDFLGTRLGRVRCQWSLTGEWEKPLGVLRCTCNPELSYIKLIFIDRPRAGYHFIRSTWLDNQKNLPDNYEQVAFGHMSADWRARYKDGDWSAATDADVLYPAQLLIRAMKPHRMGRSADVDFGVDVGSAGDDESVVFMRTGIKSEILWHGQESNILTFAGMVAGLADRYNPQNIKVDAVGLGEGVWRDLEREGYPVTPMIGGAKPMDETRNYRNQRAEIAWQFREMLQEDRVWLPNYPELINELGTIRYSQTASGQAVQVESKKEIKKRLGRSPDLADACIYAYAYADGVFGALSA